MSDKTSLSLQLAEDDVQRIISETIKSQVAASFAARGGKLAEEVVSSFLFQGVDYHGRPTGRPRERNEITYVNKIVSESLACSMREVVIEWVKQNDEKLRKTVSTVLNRTRGDIANQLVASLVESAGSAYRCQVTVALGIPEDD